MSGGEVGYVDSGELDIAYEISGAGPPDVVVVPGLVDTIEAARVYEPARRLVERLRRFARVIRHDKRGTGLSDRLPPDAAVTIADRVADVLAVMDAAGAQQAAVLGVADGGIVAMELAARHPERVASLAVMSSSPRIAWAEDWPWGTTAQQWESATRRIAQSWGQGAFAWSFGITDETGMREIGRVERLASTPKGAEQFFDSLMQVDIRDHLVRIAAPTLVVNFEEHTIWPREAARYIAEQIPNARYVELPGQPGGPGLGTDAFLDLVEEHVTGRRRATDADRVLKTVPFTDIVASTEQLAAVGDRRWRELLDEHDVDVRRALQRCGGQWVNTTGDGYFAVFDSPARAIECARAIVEDAGRLALGVRAGVHTGECEVRGGDYAGLAVHIGARVGARARAGEVLVTSTVRDLVMGSSIEFADAGLHELKGLPGEWQLLAVQ